MVGHIGNINISVTADGQVVRVFECRFSTGSVRSAIRSVATGDKLQFPVGCKPTYRTATGLCDVQVSGRVEGQVDRLIKLCVAGINRFGTRSLYATSRDNLRVIPQQMERKDIRGLVIDNG